VGAGDPFSMLGSQAQAHYLLNGKPLPGSTLETKIFPYMEQVSLTFLNGYEMTVTYKLSWQDVFADGQPVKVLTFSFNKYDYSTL
jgi:hypothetical protein